MLTNDRRCSFEVAKWILKLKNVLRGRFEVKRIKKLTKDRCCCCEVTEWILKLKKRPPRLLRGRRVYLEAQKRPLWLI